MLKISIKFACQLLAPFPLLLLLESGITVDDYVYKTPLYAPRSITSKLLLSV